MNLVMVFPHGLVKRKWACVYLYYILKSSDIWRVYERLQKLTCNRNRALHKPSLSCCPWRKRNGVTGWGWGRNSHHRARFYCPDKMSLGIILTGSCPFSCPRCNGAARDHRENHTLHFSPHPSLLLWSKMHFMDVSPPVQCRWVKYYIKASWIFHSTSHISPRYQVQN